MKNGVAICIPNITKRAGTERAVSNLASILIQNGFSVFIISMDSKSGDGAYPLPKKVSIIHLSLRTTSQNLFIKYQSLLQLWCFLRKFCADNAVNVIIGTHTLLNCVIALLPRQIRKIGCEHCNYSSVNFLNRVLRRVFYNVLSAVVLLTKEDADNYHFVHKKKVFVIPNSISFVPVKNDDYSHKTILAIGRLTYQKGFDRLITIAAALRPSFPDWHFCIVGNGEDERTLRNKIKILNLEKYVTITPPQNDVTSLYHAASIYAMTSHFEGLPMVLIEAQSCGLPIVSFDCPYGPSSVIHNEKDGFLIQDGDITSFEQKLAMLMKDKILRENFGNEAFQSAVAFSTNSVATKWNDCLNQICGGKYE